MPPLHDYVILRRKDEAHLSAGGIMMPDSVAESLCQVVAVGGSRILEGGKVVRRK